MEPRAAATNRPAVARPQARRRLSTTGGRRRHPDHPADARPITEPVEMDSGETPVRGHTRRRFVDAFMIDTSAALMIVLIQQLYQVEPTAVRRTEDIRPHNSPPQPSANRVAERGRPRLSRQRPAGRRPAQGTADYFHSHSVAEPLPCASTSHSPTPSTLFRRAHFGDAVCMTTEYRNVVPPFSFGQPTPCPFHVKTSP